MWEADIDHTDVTKSYEELLNKVKDYARKRKLDSTAQKNMQHGADPMDVGAAQGDWSEYHCGECGEEDIGAVGYYGYKGKGKGKSKGKGGGSGYNCCWTAHFARECPNPQKGKAKGDEGKGKG